MYLLGYDIGSSSIKSALVHAETGEKVAVSQYPDKEMDMLAAQPGWAEQHPETWWEAVRKATAKLLKDSKAKSDGIKAIGISYQMHGLVLVNRNQQVLRPSIIWCDSRAVEIGKHAFEALGTKQCLGHLLNSPSNFTASKLRWVKENEPDLYKNIYKMMLPGDFIAMKMTDEITTTVSGLSEGMLWDFQEEKVANFLLDHYEIDPLLIPKVVETFSNQGTLTEKAATLLGLPAGIRVGYRAGDQPNNALSLNVFEPGEVAATGGTSGVVYGVVDRPLFDKKTRVNSFAHVTHTSANPRIGVLLCINGAGIQYNWMRQMLAGDGVTYSEIEKQIGSIPVGSEGLMVIPFGNGAERVLENKNPGSGILNLEFNRHGKPHLYRAALEGIAFSFVYGMEIMKEMGLSVDKIRVGNDNLFQSNAFTQTISNTLGCEIEMIDTTGAVGAAKAAGVGAGVYSSLNDAFRENSIIKTYMAGGDQSAYKATYQGWKSALDRMINK
ncbi:MAG: FGGY family carbohydrate kinase [Bacteroidota bacterium]